MEFSALIAAKMNVQLIVSLLIVNAVLAKAYYGSRPHGYDYGRLLPGLGNPKKRITNFKLQPVHVVRDAQRKVHF